MTITPASIIKTLLIFFLVFAGLYFGKLFLVPLATGALLAALFLPLCKWLEEKNWHKGLAALTCLFVLLLAIAGIVALLSWQISELAEDLETLKQKGSEFIVRAKDYISGQLGISEKKQEEMLEDQQPSGKIVTLITGSIVYILTYLILTFVYMFLLLYYRSHMKDFILKLSLPEQRKEMQQVIFTTATVAQQYLVGLAKMIFGLWIMYSIGFNVVGIDNAFFFAILCGLLEIIPYIGNITGTIITVLVSAAQGASPGMLGGIIITYGIVQFIQGWLLEPLIVGPQVKINPMATILALVVGEMVWGIPGVFLAIPLMAMFKILCDHVEPLKPIGFLVGEVKTEKEESALSKKIKSWFEKNNK